MMYGYVGLKLNEAPNDDALSVWYFSSFEGEGEARRTEVTAHGLWTLYGQQADVPVTRTFIQ
jgi:hypothetical protein